MEKNPFQIIAANYSGFSKVFHRIADSVLEHPDQVLASNIHQLGRELEIAESSIVRFCKALGYSGFSELKLMLAKYGRQSSKIIFENLKDGSPEAVSREIFSLSIETLQIAEIANGCGISVRTPERLFVQALHCTPVAYLMERRLLRGAELLLSTDNTISEIALVCGFCDGNHFSKMFNRKFAMPPSEYRRKFAGRHSSSRL